MDKITQQKKLDAGPYFGNQKRELLTKLFDSVKSALTPSGNQRFLKDFNSGQLESYIIFRNGVHYETFAANECACMVEIIALEKKYPHDDWAFKPNGAMQSNTTATVAA